MAASSIHHHDGRRNNVFYHNHAILFYSGNNNDPCQQQVYTKKTLDIGTTLYQSHNIPLGSSQYEGRNASHEVSHKCIW